MLVKGVIPPQAQALAFHFVELHKVPVGSLFHLLEVALDGSTMV